MTIDKFGRHIHKHVIKRHLEDEDVLSSFIKHPKLDEVLGVLIKKNILSTSSKTEPKIYTLMIHSDGTIAAEYYLLSSKTKGVTLYKNKMYEGRIVKVHYSSESLTLLHIGGRPFDEKLSKTQPYSFTKDTKLKLKYRGPSPTPAKTEAVYVEIFIEGNIVDVVD